MNQNRLSAYTRIVDQEEYTELDAMVVFCGRHRDWSIDIEPAAQELLDLRARLAKAEELLKEYEWVASGPDFQSECPDCFSERRDGHESDCKLAAFLKGIK